MRTSHSPNIVLGQPRSELRFKSLICTAPFSVDLVEWYACRKPRYERTPRLRLSARSLSQIFTDTVDTVYKRIVARGWNEESAPVLVPSLHCLDVGHLNSRAAATR